MSLSSARNYALRASRSQDQKEAIELLSKAILELAPVSYTHLTLPTILRV